MFFDEAKIYVAAGKGGNGCISFRREKHVPRGGPDGGDGGRGGDVRVVANPQLRDLQAFTFKVHHKAGAGQPGQGARRHGAMGATIIIEVPLGTQIWREDELIADLLSPGQEALLASGGTGGRGNTRFVGPTRQSPKFAELGGEEDGFWVRLSLKLMADAGLAGLPNAGKSSLLRRLSNAKPKVANYPFTTLEPMLGVVDWSGEGDVFTLADVPGLLEGASDGVGLGHEFLAHLERCQLIVHVVDLMGYYGDSALDGFRTILGELDAHTPELGAKPQVVILNKMDAVPAEAVQEMRSAFEAEIERLRREGHPAFTFELNDEQPDVGRLVWPVSAATGIGLQPFVQWLGPVVKSLVGLSSALVGSTPQEEWGTVPQEAEERTGHVTYRPRGAAKVFAVTKEDGLFQVRGKALKRLVSRFDLTNEEAIRYLGERLDRLGVYAALRSQGAQPGDDVDIEGYAFEYH